MANNQQKTGYSNPSNRVAIVDILRAYAILGVVLINYTLFKDTGSGSTDPVDRVLEFLTVSIFFRKSALLLSVLFGYGFSVLIDNLRSKDDKFLFFFLKRMFWLFVIAFINSLFFDGDILKSYAILGPVLLLFYRLPTKTILYIGIILLLLIPFSSGYTINVMSNKALDTADKLHPLFLSHNFVDVVKYNLINSYIFQATWPFYAIAVQHIMLCCFVWGMYIHRIRFFENINLNIVFVKRIFWYSLLAFSLSTYISNSEKHIPILHNYYAFFVISFLCAMLFFCSAILWLYVSGKLKRLFSAMAYLGKMTLTNYMMQNIISFFVFSGVGLAVNKVSYWFYVTLALVVFIIQLFLSRYWLKNYYYGPVEWFWRCASSGKKLPFKIS